MTLSYKHGASEVPLMANTVGTMLDGIAAQFPDNEALVSVFEDRRLTYRELQEKVNRCARALIALGVDKNDHVGIWATNCIAWVVVQFAAAKTGAVLVNLNPAYRLTELEYALNQSHTRYLIFGEGFKDAVYAEMIAKLSGKLPHLRKVISLVPTRAITGREEFLSNFNRVTPTTLEERQASLDFDDVINLQYTSGTTGFPKGAMLTHFNILNNAFWIGERMRLSPRDRLCVPVPFYHCFGMVLGCMACITHGATMVLPAPHFSPIHTLEAVAKEHCTALHGVPTMFIAELDHPRFREFDLSSLRTGIMAGAPCPMEVMKRVISDMHLPEITIACGMTETSPVCNMTEVTDPIEVRVGTVGKVMPHQEQKIVDPATGRILPRGEPGELCYRGYQVMRGYFNDPLSTGRTIDEARWLHSGDLAVMDEQGYLQVTGRLKDMICRGGEKIFPREVEEFLFTHPAIAEAYVIGVPDPYYGEQVVAWVKLKEGANLTADELRAFCKGQIMDYKIPSQVKFVTEFPITVTGKIQKYRMRELSGHDQTLGR